MKSLTVGRVFGFVAVLIALAMMAYGEDYKPLTIEEAKAYMARASPDQIAEQIVKLDFIEHAAPVVTMPRRITVLEQRDLVVWNDGPIVVQVGKYLEYRLTQKAERIVGFVPIDWSWLWWGIGGAGAGILTGLLGAVAIPMLTK
jgi:hypothetical protein